MIILDPRVGSGELLDHFANYDVEVRSKHIDFGDAWFWGNGDDGPVKIGVERKGIKDLVSSMRSDRLSGFQLRGLVNTYAWVYLLIEGVYRCSNEGVVEIFGGRSRMGGAMWSPLTINGAAISFREVNHYINTLQCKCGIIVDYTGSDKETVAWLVSQYKWWEKPWDKHDAHEVIYAPYEHILPGRRGGWVQKEIGPIELVAAQYPKVSKKAFNFRKHFKSARQMANAEVKELTKVEGIGKDIAKLIFDWWRKGE